MRELIIEEVVKEQEPVQQIKVPDISGPKRNGILYQIGLTKRTGTNYIILPADRFDKDTKKWLRQRGYKLQPKPLKKEILVEWQYEASCRPGSGYGKVCAFNGRV